MRKINTNYTNSHSNNHSQFYNAFDKEFSTILDPRPIGNDTYKSYIKNELTETAVRRFVSNSEKRLPILKGPQGSGKSSTLFALHREFNKRKTYTSAVIDLLTCISAIPEDFSKIKDLDRQVASCVPSARRLITSSMQRKTDRLLEEENLKDSDIICDVFRYIYDYHNHVVPSSIALKNIEKWKILFCMIA